ncbi:MAG: SMC-Scp complex subunit ScpB [Actinobacteria bacterium]|nr:SMC-Scp complex subunit ScpB [Actinomycetota bacterium]
MTKKEKDKSVQPNNNENWLKSCTEGIFFISEKPVTVREIFQSLNISEKKASDIIDKIEKEYKERNGGFILRKIGGGYKFYSNPNLNDVLKDFVKSNISTYLSQAALETLAIICYRQPVTRTQVAEIRGVRTDSVFQTLVNKGLIKDAGRLKEPGNPILYRTTDRFLEILGVNSLKDLPPLKNFEDSND